LLREWLYSRQTRLGRLATCWGHHPEQISSRITRAFARCAPGSRAARRLYRVEGDCATGWQIEPPSLVLCEGEATSCRRGAVARSGRAPTQIIPNAGHWPQFEQPTTQRSGISRTF
jgi:pimeloyl-ACP methyl ester carboxylesterase